MNIIINITRQVIVDYMRYATNIKTSRSDVSRDHHARFARFEVCQCPFPFGLSPVSVNGTRSITVFLYEVMEPSSCLLFGNKD